MSLSDHTVDCSTLSCKVGAVAFVPAAKNGVGRHDQRSVVATALTSLSCKGFVAFAGWEGGSLAGKDLGTKNFNYDGFHDQLSPPLDSGSEHTRFSP